MAINFADMLSHRRIIEKLTGHMAAPGNYPTPIEGLSLHRRDEINIPENCFFNPAITVLVQGRKRTMVGNEEYDYGEGQCLINNLDLPSTNYIYEASPEKPFLVMALSIDKRLAMQLAAEMLPKAKTEICHEKNICIAQADPDVLDAFFRLLELLDKPEQIPVLAPMIIREIHYRILIGPQGGFMRMVNTLGSQSNQIARAINWLKDNYREPLQINELARHVNMATSTFHRHFKQVTTLSPLQYQKRLRLYEAQRLMLVENEYAASACAAVGYESPAQFNREYKRLFGKPPAKDVNYMRAVAAVP
ncbi:MAG: AraC family transcriptional regulator [Oxalobacter formigenes]|nr:AraC family transcriptional regulator [Oxalobacter formigenes]